MKYRIVLSILPLLLLPPPLLAGQQEEFSLPDIVELGLSNNPLLKAQARDVEATKAAYQASRRLFNPTFAFQAGRAESYDGTEERNTNGLSLSQYLENPLKRHYRIRMSENEWQAVEFSLSSARLDVVYEVKRHFFMILLLKEKEELALKSLESLEEAHRLIRTRVELGETRELEAIKLEVEVLRARNVLSGVRTQLQLARQHMNVLLGNTLPEGFSLVGELVYTPLTVQEDILRDTALRRHPLINRMERYLEQARNRLSYARSSRIPDPELSGFIDNELDGKNRGVGISLTVPLWNFGTKQITEARSMSRKQDHEMEALRLEVATNVAVHLNTLRLSAERIDLFHSGLLKQAEESLKISEASYRQGEISLIDYLDSQRTYYSILNDYYDSLYTWNVDKAALEKATGEEIQ